MKEQNLAPQESHCGILVATKDRRVHFANSTFAVLAGIKQSVLAGHHADHLFEKSPYRIFLLEVLNALRFPGQTISRIVDKEMVSGDVDLRILGVALADTNQIFLEAPIFSPNEVLISKEMKERICLLEAENKELRAQKMQLEQMTYQINAELEIARKIQEGILPTSLPQIPGYEFAAEYLPSEQVGGDFYNLRMLDEDHLLILQADVSGHGVPAAFITTIAKAYFDRFIHINQSLPEAMEKLNGEFCDNLKTDHYLTAFVAILNIRDGSLRYCRICHPYPIIYRAASQSIEYMKATGGFFLGMMREKNEFLEHSTVLRPGDRLLIYTDGLNEGFNHENSQYGRERLSESAQRHALTPAKEFLRSILRDRADFMNGQSESDDITAMVIARQA